MQNVKSIAIMQPYFFPYLGYFQLMASVDTFVFYDDVNFIKRGWINRNRINLNGMPYMVTIPLQNASQNKLICEIDIIQKTNWRFKTLKTLQHAYAKTSQFDRIFPLLEKIINHPANNLSDYLYHSLKALHEFLGLQTRLISTSRIYGNNTLKAQSRIIDICKRENADCFVNTIGGFNLYGHEDFIAQGLNLEFLRPVLPCYKTGSLPFVPALSIVDVMMHNSADAIQDLLHKWEKI